MPYGSKQEYKRINSKLRNSQRLCRLYLIVSAVGIGLFVMQTAERARDAKQYESTIESQRAEVAQCRTTTEIIQATPEAEE